MATCRWLHVDRPGESGIGFAGVIGAAAEIHHVGVVDASVSGRELVGGFVGDSLGRNITNSCSTGAVEGTSRSFGGLVGRIKDAAVKYSHSTSDLFMPPQCLSGGYR